MPAGDSDRPTALKIPCPWSGDEKDPVPRTYGTWLWLYETTRKLRHLLGLHDWHLVPAYGPGGRRCTWCGTTGAL
ncbi:hypothetical protein GCM10020000_06600 [Streptomyces olivoverticillatus]